MSKVKKKKRLTDKHFKSWDLQRIHRYIHTLPDARGRERIDESSYNAKSILAWSTLLTSYVLGFFVWCILVDFVHRLDGQAGGVAFVGLWVWIYGCWYFAFFTNRTLMLVANILYLPASHAEHLLIDPDGNPEMCFLSDYPALEGFYGYRLPNVGDLSKIERYMNNC